MMETRIVKQDGMSVSRYVYFQAQSPTEITPEMAKAAQTILGYSPMGYSFEDLKVSRDPVLYTYKATWRCQASCD